MVLPFFYIPNYDPANPEIMLDEDNSRHVIQVLRMKPGERLRLTDGRGHLLEGEIADAHKKHCRVAVREMLTVPPPAAPITIAISPLKNASRFEWFLEKATEIGVSAIIPLLCARTERQSIRADRLRNILVSAMLQSQQAWLPDLPEPMPFSELVAPASGAAGSLPAARLRLIAHCLEAPRATASLAAVVRGSGAAGMDPVETDPVATAGTHFAGTANPGALILIGPEGDFTSEEVDTALEAGYLPVSLGQNRLRTETAGVVAATLLCIK